MKDSNTVTVMMVCCLAVSAALDNSTDSAAEPNRDSLGVAGGSVRASRTEIDEFTREDSADSDPGNLELTDFVKLLEDQASGVNTDDDDQLKATATKMNAKDTLIKFFQLDLVSTARKMFAKHPASVYFPRPQGVHELCYGDLMAFMDGLVGRHPIYGAEEEEDLRTEDWAVAMFDASGKPNSGILDGRLQFVGSYELCVNLKASVWSGTHSSHGARTNSWRKFGGRYCRARLPMGDHIQRRLPENVNTFWLKEEHLPININWGLCVPDSCTSEDVKTFLTKETLGEFKLPVEEVTCYIEPDLQGDPAAIFVIALLSLFAGVVLVCSCIDIYRTGRDNSAPCSSRFWFWPGALAEETKHTPLNPELRTHIPGKEAIESTNEGTTTEKRSEDEPSSRENGTVPTEKCSGCPSLPVEMSSHDAGSAGGDRLSNGCTGSGEPKENVVTDTLDAEVRAESDENDQVVCISYRRLDDKHPLQEHCGSRLHGILNEAFEMVDLEEGDVAKQPQTLEQLPTDRALGEITPVVIEPQEGKQEDEDAVIEHADKPNAEGGDADLEITERQDHGTMRKKKWSLSEHFIKGASLYRNFLQLMNTKRDDSKRTIKCLEGLKAISMAWVVLGHTYTFGGIIDDGNVLYDNSLEMTNIPHRLAFHIVGSAQFGVDTFFVICGCLVMFITMEKLRDVRQKFKFWFFFIFHRFWRLTPIYMVVMAIGTTLYNHMVQGPLKASNLEEFYQCRSKWWAHLLYINNFYRPDNKCMTWTWYLAVDMQFHVLSPFFIYSVYRNRKIGTTLILLLTLLGMVAAFSAELRYGGQFLLMDMNFVDYWSYVYTMPWARVSAFAIGLYLGVLLRNLDSEQQSCERFLQGKWTRRLYTPVMWVLNLGVGLGLALMTHAQWKHGSGHWSRPALAVFECLSRPLWSMAVAWVIFACNTGRAGPVYHLLSWSPFVIVSRLSYSMYLLHPVIILFVVYSRRTTIYLHPDRIDQAYSFMGHFVLTLLFAVVLYLLVEAPLQSVEVLWNPKQKPRSTSQPIQQEQSCQDVENTEQQADLETVEQQADLDLEHAPNTETADTCNGEIRTSEAKEVKSIPSGLEEGKDDVSFEEY